MTTKTYLNTTVGNVCLALGKDIYGTLKDRDWGWISSNILAKTNSTIFYFFSKTVKKLRGTMV